jgi:hypothetical protein
MKDIHIYRGEARNLLCHFPGKGVRVPNSYTVNIWAITVHVVHMTAKAEMLSNSTGSASIRDGKLVSISRHT